MRSIAFRLLLASVAAGAIVAMAATQGDTASVGKPVVGARSAGPASSVEELKVDYRRPDTIPFPKDNPYTVEKVALGKKLFFDTRLSAANLLSCASCHNPAYGWATASQKASATT
jgi:cytochrome c peroxidase